MASVKKTAFSLLLVMFSLIILLPLEAEAAIAFVQKVSNTTSSARTLSLKMPAKVTAGNLLVVSVSGWPNLPAAQAVTDSLGNSYAPAGNVLLSQGAYSAIYYAWNVKEGTDTVTFTTVSSGGQISMVVAEFSGVDTVSPLDKTSGLTGSGNIPSSGSMTPALAGSLIIGSGTHNGSTVTSAGSGFTMIDIPTEDSDTHQPLAMEYRVLNGTQPIAATLNLATAYPWTQNGVIFRPSGGSPVTDTTSPTVTAFTIPATSTSLTVPVTSFTATDNIAVTGYLLTESAAVPSATASGWSATAPSSYIFATAGSKTLYSWARDAAGNVSASRSASIVITVAASDRYSIWSGTTVPGTVDSGPDSPVELGVKFRSDSSGFVTGIKFYKASTNTGTHVANLWSNSGARLATATFSGESASGWQQVNFSTPVAVTANTVYVASYHTNTGHYSDDQDFFTGRSVDNPPLHALADSNGVYAYGSASAFPSQTWRNTNYWVDVVFSSGSTPVDTTSPTVTAFAIPASSVSLTVPVTSFTATDNIAVTGYLLTESAAVPSATASGWSATAPVSYTFAAAGTKTLYAWARDAAGNVSASRNATVVVTVTQSAGPEPAGWYAGDMHVHHSCGGSPEAVASIFQKMDTHKLSFLSLQADMGNGEVQNPYTDLPLVTGRDSSLSTSDKILHWDAEWHWDPVYWQYPHQALGGHIVALGLSEAHQIWEEYTYPIFDWAHQQNGIVGFAHMQYLDNSIPQNLTCCTPLEYPVEVALGTADFISEDVMHSGSRPANMYSDSTIQAYYRLLNCGFRPGLAAGTDYPCNDGTDPGALLTYVQVAGGMNYNDWINGIARGKTVVSRNGHREFLDFKVNDSATPGAEIRLTGGGAVQVSIKWSTIQNLSGTIELVQNGVVIASRQATAASGAPVTLAASANFSKSGWLAARRMGSDGHQLHTAAVFIIVDNAPIRANAEDANFYVSWMDNLLEKTSPGGPWNIYFPTNLEQAQARYRSARDIYRQIAVEAGGTPEPPPEIGSIYSSQIPAGFVNDGVSYELGTRFRTDVNGQVTQVRLYTGPTEGGTHTVRIWRMQDKTVISGPFNWNITSGTTGWRSITLPAPLSVAANTDYIVAVSTGSDKSYAASNHGFDVPIINGHLQTFTGSGLYSESTGTMPTFSWQNSGYFRDVSFLPGN